MPADAWGCNIVIFVPQTARGVCILFLLFYFFILLFPSFSCGLPGYLQSLCDGHLQQDPMWRTSLLFICEFRMVFSSVNEDAGLSLISFLHCRLDRDFYARLNSCKYLGRLKEHFHISDAFGCPKVILKARGMFTQYITRRLLQVPRG